MTDRNDGRPKHSASHMHCAVPFFCARSGTEGGGSVALRGMGCEVGGECIAQPAGVRRRCVGERKCSGRACRCAGARGGLRRGMGGEVGGRASRSLRACVGAAWGSGSARRGRVAVRGRAKVFGGEWVVRSARNASRSLRACVGAAWASGSAREGVSLCGGERRSSAGNGW